MICFGIECNHPDLRTQVYGIVVGSFLRLKRKHFVKQLAQIHVQLLSFDDAKVTYRVILVGGKLFDEHDLPVRSAEQRQAK